MKVVETILKTLARHLIVVKIEGSDGVLLSIWSTMRKAGLDAKLNLNLGKRLWVFPYLTARTTLLYLIKLRFQAQDKRNGMVYRNVGFLVVYNGGFRFVREGNRQLVSLLNDVFLKRIL